MKKNYDEYLKRIYNIKDEKKKEKYSSLVSSLPLILVSKKMIIRKNSGKKPFSKAFDFENTLNIINNNYSLIEDELIKKNPDYLKSADYLNEIKIIVEKATNEIKMESLKNDFVYIYEQVKEIVSLLSH